MSDVKLSCGVCGVNYFDADCPVHGEAAPRTNTPTKPAREWWTDLELCKQLLFDKHHKLPLEVSSPYSKYLYLVNQQNEIVLSFSAAISAYLEVCERLETVNSTNRLKQMTIIELQQQRDELSKENERLKVYKNTVYDYVQCTGNTSPKFLGYHVAEALVLDHKQLQAKCAGLTECLEKIAWLDHYEDADGRTLANIAREALEKWGERG